jgi:hypothetical protein
MPFNFAFNWFIRRRMAQIDLARREPVESQRALMGHLLFQGAKTSFGREHGLQEVRNLRAFKQQVPVRTYDELKPWIEQAIAGQSDVLWPGMTAWFAKSSGTTSDRSKYLPITQESLKEGHFKGGKDLLALFCEQRPSAKLYEGKHLVLGGARAAESKDQPFIGDLSAIVMNELPFWVEARRTPSRAIALMADWEQKVDAISYAVMKEDVRILAGVPSWMLVIAKRVLELTEKETLAEVWPNLQLFMHGGVHFAPYRSQFQSMVGDLKQGKMAFMETYNASEGFFALQDEMDSDSMLLLADYGIYFEFAPSSEWGKHQPETLELRELEVGEDYELIITTVAGLWRYRLGDVVRMTELHPFRLQVVGRTQAFLNAFGEEVMSRQIEEALNLACAASDAIVREFTVAPIFMSQISTGGHEWFIEFVKPPSDRNRFMAVIDDALQRLNSDYAAKRSGDLAMGLPRLHGVPTGTFEAWLRSKGRMGGQFKVPRCASTRQWVNELLLHVEVPRSHVEVPT